MIFEINLIQVYMNVLSDSGEEKLAVIVKCNNGVRSNLWKADAKIDVSFFFCVKFGLVDFTI